MNRKKLVMLLVFGFITFCLNANSVFAATSSKGSCSAGGVDQSQWKFDHTDTVQAGEDKDFDLEIVKRVCCEKSGTYYCDYYTSVIEEATDGSKELTDIPCDLSDGNWTFQRSYTSPSNASTTTQNGKICCKGNGLKNGAETFRCNSYTGKKAETTEKKSPNKTSSSSEKKNATGANCGILSDLVDPIQEIYGYLKIIMPIALIIFGAIDFSGPVLSSDKDALKKAGIKFTKRCIIVIAIFLVPAVLRFVLQAYSDATGKDASLCGLIGMVIQNWR